MGAGPRRTNGGRCADRGVRRRGRRQAKSVKRSGYTALLFSALLIIYPFVIQLATSFKTDADASADPLR